MAETGAVFSGYFFLGGIGTYPQWKPESLWRSYWDRFIIHLTQGKSLESFLSIYETRTPLSV